MLGVTLSHVSKRSPMFVLSFVLLCLGIDWFSQFLQGLCNDNRVIIWLSHSQWSNPEEYGYMRRIEDMEWPGRKWYKQSKIENIKTMGTSFAFRYGIENIKTMGTSFAFQYVFSKVCWHKTSNPHSKVYVAPTWGPPGSCRPQVGPMLAPWILLSGKWPIGSQMISGAIRFDSNTSTYTC